MKIRWVLLLSGLLSATVAEAQVRDIDYYLNQAIANSPLLKDYQNQVRSTYYDSLLLRAGFKPQVTATSFDTYAPVINGYGYDQAITNGGNFNALVGINKQILNGKNFGAQLNEIHLQRSNAENGAKIAESDLKRTVIAQYITTYGDQLQLSFNKEIDTLLSQEELVLKKLTEKNVYRQVDYLAFLVTLQQQKITIRQLTIQYQNDHAMLNYLTGILDTPYIELQKPDIHVSPLHDMRGLALYKQFEIDSMKLVNSKLLADINYRPKINLFADAGYNTSLLAQQAYKNFGSSFGINISIPIYDGGQRKLQYSKISIAQKTAENYKSFYSKQYELQTAQLTQQLQGTEELINDISNQLKYAEGLIKANAQLLETGDVRITDYILSINSYLNIKNLITQNSINRLQIINQINYRTK